MQQFWHKEYPAGVPSDVDTSQYNSLVDLLEESFSKFKNDNAYVLMDKFMTYGELDEKW